MKKTAYLLTLAASALLLSACNQAGKTASLKPKGQDAWCQEHPNSAVCPQGQAALQQKNSWCEENPMSAVCPQGKAAVEKKASWCADYPDSAVCS